MAPVSHFVLVRDPVLLLLGAAVPPGVPDLEREPAADRVGERVGDPDLAGDALPARDLVADRVGVRVRVPGGVRVAVDDRAGALRVPVAGGVAVRAGERLGLCCMTPTDFDAVGVALPTGNRVALLVVVDVVLV